MNIAGSLKALDFVVIAVYLVGVLSLGFWVSFRRKNSEDLFLAGRSLRWPYIGFSIMGTNINPSMMLAACAVAYSSGMVAANFEWLAWWFLLLLAMVFVPHYMNTRISTMPEFLERRFSRSCRDFLAWYALFTTVVLWLGGTLYAGGLLLSQLMNWPLWVCVLLLTAVSASFTVTGGLLAVAVTDAFQVVLMVIGSVVLLVIALVKAGGVYALAHKVPPDYWRLFRDANDVHYPWPAIILGYPVLGVWFWCTDQTIVQRVLGARDTREGQLGAIFAAFLKVITPILFYLPGILCFLLYPGLKNPDEAYMTMVVNLLPPGMVGLIISVLIAALVSTVDAGLNSFGTVFTLDVYCKKIRPNAGNGEIRWVGRLTTLGAAIIAIICALAMHLAGRNLFDLLQSIIAYFAPPMAAVFLVGTLWRRATAPAALITLVIGSIVSLGVGGCQLADYPSKEFWPHYLMVSFYLFAVLTVLMIFVSLVTPPPPPEKALPRLRDAHVGERSSKLVWSLWAILGVVMGLIYWFFN